MTEGGPLKEGLKKNIKEAFIYSQILDRSSAKMRRRERFKKRGRRLINGKKSLEE